MDKKIIDKSEQKEYLLRGVPIGVWKLFKSNLAMNGQSIRMFLIKAIMQYNLDHSCTTTEELVDK